MSARAQSSVKGSVGTNRRRQADAGYRDPERRALARQRRHQAVEAYVRGASMRSIARSLGVSAQAVSKMLRAATEPGGEIGIELVDVQRLRVLEASRMSQAIVELWPALREGKSPAQRAAVGMAIAKLSERRARLLGLDVPERELTLMQQNVMVNVDEKAEPVTAEHVASVLGLLQERRSESERERRQQLGTGGVPVPQEPLGHQLRMVESAGFEDDDAPTAPGETLEVTSDGKVVSATTWMCATCDATNNGAEVACMRCGRHQHEPEVGWLCEAPVSLGSGCDTWNAADAVVCAKCGSRRGLRW